MSMKQSERDPIEIPRAVLFDPCFADLYLSAGNGPRDSDNSISIDGHVDFGERNQIDGERDYRIGIRCAFLKINTVHCNFEPNGQQEVRVQEGAIAETHKASKIQNFKAQFLARAKLALNGPASGASANGSAGIGLGRSSTAERKSKQKYQIYLVFYGIEIEKNNKKIVIGN
jgi:hypothetical protein